MTQAAAIHRQITRPLKVLIPLIQSELQQGNNAGYEHYTQAGLMLIEAKDQIPYGGWGRWLAKNFELNPKTASVYMRWARQTKEQIGRGTPEVPFRSLGEMRGDTERRREQSQSPQQQAFRRVLRDITRDRDNFVQERQKLEDQIKWNRKIALDFVEAGYRAMAMKWHPDHGGTKDGMAVVNRIRDEFKHLAQTRRFL